MIEESEMVEMNEVDRLVNTSKDRAVFGMEYFLRNFSHVPDDRLTWVPTPTASRLFASPLIPRSTWEGSLA